MNPKDYVLSVRIKNDKQGPQTGDVILDNSSINIWAKTSTYNKDDVVVYENQFYQANDDVPAGTDWNSESWTQIGIPDLIVNDWEPETHYNKTELVVCNHKLYAAKTEHVSSVEFYEDDWYSLSGETYTFTSEDRTVSITINDGQIDFSVDSLINRTKADLEAQIDNKIDKVPNKGLSTNDFTTEQKEKLDSLVGILSLGSNLTLDADGKLSAGFSINFDNALSTTSSNAVQNKAITAEINTIKQDIQAQNSQITQNINDIQNNIIAIQTNTSDITDLQADVSNIQSDLNSKVDKVSGKELSSNDYTDAEQTKLSNLPEIKTIGSNLTLDANGVLSAKNQTIALESTTGTSTTKGMTQKAITDAIANAVSDSEASLADVATSGSYNDLVDAPTIDSSLSTTSTNAVQNKVITEELDKKANDSDLGTVAKSNDYNDLTNKPTIDNALSLTSDNLVKNKVVTQGINNAIDGLADVAKTGSYNDLVDKPSINIKDGKLTVKDADNNTLISFTANQSSDSDSTIPAATSSQYGFVKLDDVVSTTSTNAIQNKAITKYVDDATELTAAHYLTKNAAGDAFSTKAEFDAATEFYYAGVTFTPTKNDYVVVLSDESKDNSITRYVAQKSGNSIVWAFQYKVSDKPFTTDQQNAIDSGITSSKVTKLDGLADVKTIGNNLTLDTTTGTLSADAQSVLLYTTTGNNTDGAMDQKTTTTELGNKLDKVTSSTIYDQAYVKSIDGQQTMMNVAETVTPKSLAYRNSDGALLVGTPTADTHATTKKYVDDNFVSKITESTVHSQAYSKDAAGNQTMTNITSSAVANTLCYRDASGRVSVVTPTSNTHAATKKYVDDKHVALTQAEYDALTDDQKNSDTIYIITDGDLPECVPVDNSVTSNKIDWSDIVDKIYPVGSIYMSARNVSPQTFIGGTWERWGAGRVPVGVDASDTDFSTVEDTGGEKTHILTVNEMPSHKHETIANGTNRAGILVDMAASAQNQWGVHWETQSGYWCSSAIMQKTGGDQPHNNLQPYITCYMWKRIA